MGYCNLCGKKKKTVRVNASGQSLIQSSMVFRSDLYVCDYCRENFRLMKAKYDLSNAEGKLQTIIEFLSGELEPEDRYRMESNKDYYEDQVSYYKELIAGYENGIGLT